MDRCMRKVSDLRNLASSYFGDLRKLVDHDSSQDLKEVEAFWIWISKRCKGHSLQFGRLLQPEEAISFILASNSFAPRMEMQAPISSPSCSSGYDASFKAGKRRQENQIAMMQPSKRQVMTRVAAASGFRTNPRSERQVQSATFVCETNRNQRAAKKSRKKILS